MKDGKLFDLLKKVKEHLGDIFGYNIIWRVLNKFFVQPILGPIFREIKEKAEKVKEQIEKIKKLKKILKIIKNIIKAIVKIFKIVIKLLSNPYVDLAILCIFLIFAIVVWLSGIMEIFGGFRGTITVDVDKMKEMNVDSSDYTDMLNTDALLEAFYQDVSDRSVYQTFNLRDMNVDGVTELIANIGGYLNIFSSDPVEERIYKIQENLLANKKKVNGVDVYDKNLVTGFSGPMNFVAYDPRYIYTDANKNPLKYLKQAEVVGSNENASKINAYFRDYFKREKTFMLSEELLYELNNWLYKDSEGAVKIVYPEAFTKPIHFVNDYMRIIDDKDSKKLGEEYVYVTQRVTLDDIRDTSSDFYNQYDAEGLIYSEPSSVVYDYAISDSNINKIVLPDHAGTTTSSASTSAQTVNVGNVSDFAKYDLEIFYDEDNDEDKDKITQVVKLYWKVKDDNKYLHMGIHVDEENVCKYFTGPYLTMDVNGSGITFDEAYNLGICDSSSTDEANKPDSGKLKWGVIDVDINDNSLSFNTETYNPDDNKASSSTTVYVDPTLNKYPRKHMQVAPLTDEGEMLASSRNLFNKVYIEVKSIKNSYRSSDQYWSDFANFIDEDTARSGDCLNDPKKMKEDMAKKWDDRQCSVIRYYISNDFVSYIKGKALELKAYFETGDAKDAEMKISSKAMYGILLEYEEYLKRYGTYNVEWEYKYFSQTENDKLAALAEFSPSVLKMATSFSFGSFLGGGIGGALSAVSEFFETDAEIYQDTFSKMVEQDEDLRSVASEYVPVAIITGNEVGNKSNTDKNSWGWGYKYTNEKDGSGQRKVKAVYGEASMQFPDYYTFSDAEWDTIIGGFVNSEQVWLNGILPSDIKSVFSKIVKFVPETSYGEITYGMPNFQRYWNSAGKIERIPWYLDNVSESESDNIFSNAVKAGTQYKYVKDEDGNAIDFRNSDYVWNDKAPVWRPAETRKDETVMVKCDPNVPGQCGRVTTSGGPDDYLPMEVKSVRDYGLGSVLSYIESRKVVFNTGVSMGEEFNEEAVKEVIKNLNTVLNGSGDKVIDDDDAGKGFIPKDILNMDITALNAEGKKSFLNIYRKAPASLEDLGLISMAFSSAQGTGATSASYNGCTYTLDGSKNATQNQYAISGTGSNCIDELYAFIPHVTQGWFDKVMEWVKFWKPDPFLDENQFWDPMYYYLTWFDYSQKIVEAGEDPFDRSAKLIEDDTNFTHFIDTTMAAMLRNVKNNPSENGYHLDGILNVDNNWFSKNFKGTGADVTKKSMDEFFDKYSGNITGLELIDKTRTEELYLIEEAATFIGEFIYTYKDTMKVIGNLSTEDAIIDDLVLLDRHYYISHYAFAIPKWRFGLDTRSFSGDDASKKCKKEKDNWISEHGKLKLTDPRTWGNDKTKIYYEDPECISTGEKQVTLFGKYQEMKVESGKEPYIVIDTPEEIKKVIDAIHNDTITNKIMINLKIFDNIHDLGGFFKNNETDIKFGIDYSEEKDFVTSNDYLRTPGYDRSGEKLLHNYTTPAKLKSDLKFRIGLVANKDKKKNIIYTPKKHVDDDKYSVADSNNQLTADCVGKIVDFTDAELNSIRNTILSANGQSTKVLDINKESDRDYYEYNCNDYGCSKYYYKSGIQWADAKDMLVNFVYADRTKRGFPLPLYLHVAGDTKEISPDQIGQFFEGEEFNSWKTRVELKDDDSFYREEYVKNYHKERETYLFDYIQNFETYVPLDVKSDDDMQLRGRDSFLSIGKSETTAIEEVGAFTDTIMSQVRTESYNKQMVTKLGVKESSMAQLVAGLMEVSIDRAPDRTIKMYNLHRNQAGLTLLEEGAYNKSIVTQALANSMNVQDSSSVDPNTYRNIKLRLTDDTEQTFILPYLGPAAIENITFGSAGSPKSNGALTTTKPNGQANSSMHTKDIKEDDYPDVELVINSTTDDRLLKHKAIDYAATKFRKLYTKTGSISGAIMSYFYGEEYWKALREVAEEDGLSTGPEWYVASDEMITKAVRKMVGDASIEVDPELYTSDVIDEVLAYVSNIDDRLKMIRGYQLGTSDSNLPEDGKNDEIVFAFMRKILGLDEAHALSFMAVMQGESGGFEARRLEGDCGNITSKSLNYIDEVDKYISTGDPRGKSKFREKCGSANGFGIAQWTSCGRKENLLEYAKSKNLSIGDLLMQLEFLQIELEGSYKKVYEDFKATDDPLKQVDILVRRFEIPADIPGAIQTRSKYREDFVKEIDRYRTAADTMPDGSLVAEGGAMAGTGNYFEDTSAYNSYNEDMLALQNSGIELWIPAKSLNRQETEALMVATGSRDGKLLNKAYEYSLLSLFTTRTDVGESADGTGTWTGSGAIAQLGTGTSLELFPQELNGLPPLFALNRPVRENVSMIVTSQFGMRVDPFTKVPGDKHTGIDFGFPAGTELFAVAPGEVIHAGSLGGYGYAVKIQHDINCISDSFKGSDGAYYVTKEDGTRYKIVGVQTLYAHLMEPPKVTMGQVITTDDLGNVIGKVGSTGNSTGPHLHFEIKVSAQKEIGPGQFEAPTTYQFMDPQLWFTTSWKKEAGSGSLPDGEDPDDPSGTTPPAEPAGVFPKYNLTSRQIYGLAALIAHEQGDKDGWYAEASLLANLTDIGGDSAATSNNLIKKATSSWFAQGSRNAYQAAYNNNNYSNSVAVQAVKDVLVNGKRTLPRYVNEHDCWNCNSKNVCKNGIKGDICSLTTNGTTKTDMSSIKNKSNYVSGQTTVKNVYGSTYTFYSFPCANCDPFGYTSTANRTKYGDGRYTTTGIYVEGSVDGEVVYTGELIPGHQLIIQ